MTPARRQTLEAALAIIADVNDADAWATRTAETRAQLTALGAQFAEELGSAGLPRHVMSLAGVTVKCTFDNGEHLLLRWAAGARTALAESDEGIPFVSAFTEIEAGGCAPPIIATSGYAEMRDLPSEEDG